MSTLARRLFAEGVEALIVTLGADGVRIWQRNSVPYYQPAFKVEVVDTLGAGDAFIAAFAAGFINGLSLTECARWGAAAGAVTAARLGVLDRATEPAAAHGSFGRLNDTRLILQKGLG